MSAAVSGSGCALAFTFSEIRVALCGKACNIKVWRVHCPKALVRRLPFLCLRVEKDLLSQRRSNLFLRHTAKQCGHICKVDFAAFCQRQTERILWRFACVATICGLIVRLLKMAVLPITFCSSSSFSSAKAADTQHLSKSQFIAALMNIAELLYECIVVLRESACKA